MAVSLSQSSLRGSIRLFAVGLAICASLPRPTGAQMPDPPDVDPELRERLVAVDHTVLDGRFEEALDELREIHRKHPHEVEVVWRLARVKVDVGIELADDRDERRRLYRSALDLAYDAAERAPQHPETHLAIALAAGQVGLISSTRERVEYSREVLEHAEHVLALNEDHDVAYHVRARWHHEVATLGFVARTALRLVYGGLPEASLDQAIRDFERAIEIEDRIVHRLELARTLIEKDRTPDAPTHLEQALRMPHYAPRDPLYQEQARELLHELEANGLYGH